MKGNETKTQPMEGNKSLVSGAGDDCLLERVGVSIKQKYFLFPDWFLLAV